MTRVALRPPGRPLTDGVVQLRVWHPDDEEQVYDIVSADPTITQWTLIPEPYTREHARGFIAQVPDGWWRGESASFCVNPVDDGRRVIGAMGVELHVPSRSGEVGYWIESGHRRQGVAQRSLRLLCDWAFDELGLGRLTASIIEGNEASMRMAGSVGFHREGVARSGILQRGVRRDGVVYSLLPGECSSPGPA